MSRFAPRSRRPPGAGIRNLRRSTRAPSSRGQLRLSLPLWSGQRVVYRGWSLPAKEHAAAGPSDPGPRRDPRLHRPDWLGKQTPGRATSARRTTRALTMRGRHRSGSGRAGRSPAGTPDGGAGLHQRVVEREALAELADPAADSGAHRLVLRGAQNLGDEGRRSSPAPSCRAWSRGRPEADARRDQRRVWIVGDGVLVDREPRLLRAPSPPPCR